MTTYKGLMKFQELVKSGGSVANAVPNQGKGGSAYRSPYSELCM